MNDQILPASLGENFLSPVNLTPEQEKLCARLDDWYALYNLKFRPSDMFRGAIFAIRIECRSNTDWMAQAAHSLREILYPFGDNGVPNKETALKEYGSIQVDTDHTDKLGRFLGSFTELAHHGNCRGNSIDFSNFKESEFQKIIMEFQQVIWEALTRQIDVHNEIDEILNTTPEI